MAGCLGQRSGILRDKQLTNKSMALLSLFSSKKSTGSDTAGVSGGGNPDDRPRPVVNRHKDNEDVLKQPIGRRGGIITHQELAHDVKTRLSGLTPQERAMVMAAADGHADAHGIDYREAQVLREELHENAHQLGLEKEDLPKIDDALNRAL